MAARKRGLTAPKVMGKVPRAWTAERDRVVALFKTIPTDDMPLAHEALFAAGYPKDISEFGTFETALLTLPRSALLQLEYVLEFLARNGRMPAS